LETRFRAGSGTGPVSHPCSPKDTAKRICRQRRRLRAGGPPVPA